MSRRNRAPKRDILPDPKYKSQVVAKFVNHIMLDGKKSVAEKIVYGAFDRIKAKVKINFIFFKVISIEPMCAHAF